VSRLLTLGGAGCIAAAAVWFLPGALLSLFLPVDRDRGPLDEQRQLDRNLFQEHWDAIRGPFYLMVFGAGLMMCATRLASGVFGR
jgi:hypothetical protein